MSEPIGDEHYRQLLAKDGLLGDAIKWVKANPPPPDWQPGPWSWAYTEMPVGTISRLVARLFGDKGI